MATPRTEVLAVGSVIVDHVCHVPRLPRSGEGIVADEVRTAIGGCAFNSANVVRQLGASVRLLAPIGVGMYAELAERELSRRGFDALRVPADDDGAVRDNGACVCLVEPDGERTMLTLPGIDRHFSRSWFDRIDPRRFSCGFASGYEIEGAGGDAIVEFFEEHPEILLYYAPGPRIADVGSRKTTRLNALRPVWHLNDQEARSYTGCATVEEAGRSLARECGNAVVVTAGADGSHVFEGGDHVTVPAESVEVVDTVGAGDAHLGALVAARNAGRSWEDALALANAIAAAVCGTRGGVLDDDVFASLGVRL